MAIKKFMEFLKTDPETRPILEGYQSVDLVHRASITLGLGASQFFWVCIRDWKPEEALDWFHVSMCVTDVDGRKKPHYYTYRLMLEKLEGFSNARLLQMEPTIVKYEFPGQPPVLVAWAKHPTTINLVKQLGGKRARITHIITEQGKTEREARVQQLPASAIPLNHIPVFVEVDKT